MMNLLWLEAEMARQEELREQFIEAQRLNKQRPQKQGGLALSRHVNGMRRWLATTLITVADWLCPDPATEPQVNSCC